MLKQDRWLLPEGIREILSPEALAIEYNRRTLLDLYYAWGYDLVAPPLVDFLDSLMTGMGHDLELMTFTVTDQLSGKQLGIRADMTPQVARIDAHHIKDDHPARFCYIGEVLNTRLEGFAQSRSPIQAGAEIYGHASFESDIEIIQLMVKTLNAVGIKEITIDLGHVAIFKSLAQAAQLEAADEAQLFDAIQRKAVTEMRSHLDSLKLSSLHKSNFLALVELHGNADILEQARKRLQGDSLAAYLDALEAIAIELKKSLPEVNLFFDLAELRGYNYHTGVVFSAYTPGHGQAIAQGGRYNDIGALFGRARPATGFSTDLAHLVALSGINQEVEKQLNSQAIFAPKLLDANMAEIKKLEEKIAILRNQGERVICELAGQSINLQQMGCNRKLENQDGSWVVIEASMIIITT